MCVLCVEYAKSKMTVAEARSVLREMRSTLDKAHVAEIEAKLEQDEKSSSTKP
jgi:hypothetical protein